MGKSGFGPEGFAPASPATASQIRAEIRTILTASQMRKLEILLTTDVALEAQVEAIADDVVREERTAFHYSNYHTW
jgi:hypothetical protein